VVVVDDECPEEGDEVIVVDPDGDVEDPDGDLEGAEGDDPDEGTTEVADPDEGTDTTDPVGEAPEEGTEVEEPQDCEPVEEEPEAEEPEGEADEAPADPVAHDGECSDAAGLVDEEGNAQSIEDTYGDLDAPHGQLHSMEVLLANCEKNPQAKGLLRALENHALHLERWQARAELRAEREAARAEAKAAREAAKAERAAAHAEAKAARAAAKAAAGHGHGH
jgi:hypothetical protein